MCVRLSAIRVCFISCMTANPYITHWPFLSTLYSVYVTDCPTDPDTTHSTQPNSTATAYRKYVYYYPCSTSWLPFSRFIWWLLVFLLLLSSPPFRLLPRNASFFPKMMSSTLFPGWLPMLSAAWWPTLLVFWCLWFDTAGICLLEQ